MKATDDKGNAVNDSDEESEDEEEKKVTEVPQDVLDSIFGKSGDEESDSNAEDAENDIDNDDDQVSNSDDDESFGDEKEDEAEIEDPQFSDASGGQEQKGNSEEKP